MEKLRDVTENAGEVRGRLGNDRKSGDEPSKGANRGQGPSKDVSQEHDVGYERETDLSGPDEGPGGGGSHPGASKPGQVFNNSSDSKVEEGWKEKKK